MYLTTLTIVRGLPGSGKSTLAARMAGLEVFPLGTRAVHIEADQYFMRDGVYTFDASKLADAHADCLKRADTALRRRFNVVVSNTFTTRSEYQPYIEMGRALGIVNIQVIDVYGSFGSVHNVPEHTLQRMRDRWEPHKENR